MTKNNANSSIKYPNAKAKRVQNRHRPLLPGSRQRNNDFSDLRLAAKRQRGRQKLQLTLVIALKLTLLAMLWLMLSG